MYKDAGYEPSIRWSPYAVAAVRGALQTDYDDLNRQIDEISDDVLMELFVRVAYEETSPASSP